MAVNPVSGTLYVSNTEARNEGRVEGPGITGEVRCRVISPRRASPSCRGARPATAPEQAHRLLGAALAARREGPQPLDPARNGGLARRHDALLRGVRLEQDWRAREGRARGRHLRSRGGE